MQRDKRREKGKPRAINEARRRGERGREKGERERRKTQRDR